jgi:hypothetical protein
MEPLQENRSSMTGALHMSSTVLAWILVLILGGCTFLLATRSNLLRDASTAARRSFSFARVQLLWWVLIIAFCFLHAYGQTFELPAITLTCLSLLGVGIGTTTVAQVIDARQRRMADIHGIARIQDSESQGFFTDILSDENGLSVHRLQALVFNVIYGVAFFTHFVRTDAFEEYGLFQYAVLGMSNVAYLGLKALENDPNSRSATAPRGVGGDELLDADPIESNPAAVG